MTARSKEAQKSKREKVLRLACSGITRSMHTRKEGAGEEEKEKNKAGLGLKKEQSQ